MKNTLKSLIIAGWSLLAVSGIAYAQTPGGLTVPQGGTGLTSIPSYSLVSGGGTGALRLVGTTSPTVGYLTATSSHASTFAGNVGIGTTTPNWQLQVAGTRPSFALSDTSAGTDAKHWLFSSQGGNLYIGSSTDAYATTTGYQAFTIKNNGNVGVGTTTPGTTFAVGGTGLFTGNLASFGLITAPTFTATSTTVASTFPLASTTQLTSTGNTYLGTTAGIVGVGTTTASLGKLTIQNSGNSTVGLHLVQTGNTGIQSAMLYGEYYGTSVNTADTSSSYYAFNVVTGSNSLGSGGTSRLYVRNDGNVGIGTTTPDIKLLTEGTIGAVSNSNTGIVIRSADLNYSGLNFGVNTSTGVASINSTQSGTGTSLPLTLNVGGNEYVRLLSNGNVGIGTTSPQSKLDVSASSAGTTLTSASTAALTVTNTNNTVNNFSDHSFSFVNSIGSTLVGAKMSAIFTDHTPASEDVDIVWLNMVAGTLGEKMRLQGSNLGLSTTTPAVKLDVYGQIRATSPTKPTCDATIRGSIQYDVSDDHFYGCRATGWTQLDN